MTGRLRVQLPKKLCTTRWASDHGGGAIFVILMIPALLAMAAVAYDGGQIFVARREMNKIAKAAARAGANSVQEDSLYDSGVPEIDTDVTVVVWRFAEAAGAEGARTVTIDDQFIDVTTIKTIEPFFRTALNFPPMEIEGNAIVRVRSAIEEDDWE